MADAPVAKPVIAVTPPHPLPAYEFLGHLPDSYGTKKLFLVARDPHVLFAYWDLSPSQYEQAAHVAHDGKVFLELYVPGEGRVQQIHVWDSHKNWYLQANRPDTNFVAQLGYYRPDGGFEVLARSAEVRTPRDTLSPNTDARFVTIPFNVPLKELYAMIASQVLPGEELAETLARLQKSNFELPFQARVPRELTAKESEELLEYLGDEEVRRRMVGSFEITEILRKRFETALSSGQWTFLLRRTRTRVPHARQCGADHLRRHLARRQGADRRPRHHPRQGWHVLLSLRLPGWPVPHPDRRDLRRRRGDPQRAPLLPAPDADRGRCPQDRSAAAQRADRAEEVILLMWRRFGTVPFPE
jgi:hypothetical protein